MAFMRFRSPVYAALNKEGDLIEYGGISMGVAMSGMYKAIRQGNEEMAVSFALCFKEYPNALHVRLALIAAEDLLSPRYVHDLACIKNPSIEYLCSFAICLCNAKKSHSSAFLNRIAVDQLDGFQNFEPKELAAQYADIINSQTSWEKEESAIRAATICCRLKEIVPQPVTMARLLENACGFVHGTLSNPYKFTKGSILVLHQFTLHRLFNARRTVYQQPLMPTLWVEPLDINNSVIKKLWPNVFDKHTSEGTRNGQGTLEFFFDQCINYSLRTRFESPDRFQLRSTEIYTTSQMTSRDVIEKRRKQTGKAIETVVKKIKRKLDNENESVNKKSKKK